MFKQKEIYRRRDIHNKFGGQQQGGISTPKNSPLVMIFTSDSGEEFGYDDGWQSNGVFYYTGEGQVGDMQFIKGNKAIRDHINNGKSIMLFKYVKQGYVEFVCELYYIGHHYKQVRDREGYMRQSIVFELMPSQLSHNPEENLEEPEPKETTLEDLRKEALSSSNEETTTIQRVTKAIKRSKAIKKYALKRANGICEACKENAPFVMGNGDPYLEVHHLKKLSDGGPDHPEWVAAICANCHRRCHHSKDADSYNDKLFEKIKEKEKQLYTN